LIIIFGIIIFVILILLIFLKKQINQKKKAYIELKYKNAEILQQKEEIITQRDEIEQRNHELFYSNEKIQNQHLKIQNSINYASKIQKAVLPKIDSLAEYVKEYFIMWKPKDIVSGDFIISKILIITYLSPPQTLQDTEYREHSCQCSVSLY